MRKYDAEFEHLVRDFLTVYPQYIERSRPELNGTRSQSKPQNRRGARCLAAEGSQPTLDRILQANCPTPYKSLARGTADLWDRLNDVVSHMVDKLNEPESRFYATLVTNVQDLVRLLPQLNVGGDPELNRFAAEIEKRLCNHNVRALKENEILRVATAHDATALLYEMDAVLREQKDAAVAIDSGAIADSMVSHMSAYMMATAQ